MICDKIEVVDALYRAAIVPVFQPLVALRTGQRVGFEVLARWRHPDRGLILPPNFIALAEEHGLIEQLSEQVFRQALLAGTGVPAPLFLAVNVSPLQLRNDRLPRQLEQWALESDFSLERVEVEITETGLFENLDHSYAIACELKDLGCGLALDDFGTGYSSLLHLQSLPFDKLKIDRSFVMTMLTRRESRKIVGAMIGLAESLDMETVAEGVESEEQAAMLLSMGCRFAQGWLYGRPMPTESLADSATVPIVVEPIHLTSSDSTVATFNLEARPAERMAHLQAIYHSAPVGLCYLDRKLRYVSINRRLAEMNRLPLAHHIGRTVKEIHPEEYAAFEPYLLRALAGEAFSGIEIVRPASITGGAPETNLASYQPAWDEAGEVVGLSIAVIDISDLKRAEAALRESDDLYRHLFNLGTRTQWIMDGQGSNLRVNVRWLQNTGGSDLSVPGISRFGAVHPEDADHVAVEFTKALASGTPLDVEYREGSPESGWRWKRSRGTPRFGQNGEILRWDGYVDDIDEMQRLEMDLLANQNLGLSLTNLVRRAFHPRPAD